MCPPGTKESPLPSTSRQRAFDPLDDRIVQAAFVFVELDGTIGAKSWIDIINPGVEIPVAASDIHGVTTEIARARGIQPADALGQIAGLLDEITECAIPSGDLQRSVRLAATHRRGATARCRDAARAHHRPARLRPGDGSLPSREP